jgi:predicted O-methyltransferase YrrM
LAAQSADRHVTDREARYGRRIGWYALVRLLKPRCVVETGVDKGLGTCVIAAALRRNAAEGSPGKVIAIDINPAAGSLVGPALREFVDFRFQDSLAALKALDQRVDIFIHDSDHTEEHERLEYEAVAPRLGPTSLVVSDNAAHTGELLAFARKTGWQFLYFSEEPKDHWWSGEGIGVALRPGA